MITEDQAYALEDMLQSLASTSNAVGSSTFYDRLEEFKIARTIAVEVTSEDVVLDIMKELDKQVNI